MHGELQLSKMRMYVLYIVKIIYLLLNYLTQNKFITIAMFTGQVFTGHSKVKLFTIHMFR